MIILDYQIKHHAKIIHACVKALKQGNVVAYPTDTSYGLAVDATNIKAIKKLYKVKGRDFKKAISIISPNPVYTKKIGQWSEAASLLAKNFWPGPLTVAVKLNVKSISNQLKILSAGTGFLAIRVPKNVLALDLAHQLGHPITSTSANLAGKPDCYSAEEIIEQYKKSKIKPDIIINVGKLPKRKPSTIVKIEDDKFSILRVGPVSLAKIKKVLK